jgi:DNA-binding GntR family transcriptional regulator
MRPDLPKPWRTPPGIPRYRHLAETLRKRILAGRAGYRPGDQFPTEPQLAEESGYSRETIRSAVRVLREEGLLEVVLGVGTYVTQHDEWKVTQ